MEESLEGGLVHALGVNLNAIIFIQTLSETIKKSSDDSEVVSPVINIESVGGPVLFDQVILASG